MTHRFIPVQKQLGAWFAVDHIETKRTKMKNKLDETKETSHKILAYLLDNPDAKDTMDGIMNWWMLQQDIKRNVALIKKTVQALLHAGLLLVRHGTDSTKYYQVNRARLAEISALIEMNS